MRVASGDTVHCPEARVDMTDICGMVKIAEVADPGDDLIVTREKNDSHPSWASKSGRGQTKLHRSVEKTRIARPASRCIRCLGDVWTRGFSAYTSHCYTLSKRLISPFATVFRENSQGENIVTSYINVLSDCCTSVVDSFKDGQLSAYGTSVR